MYISSTLALVRLRNPCLCCGTWYSIYGNLIRGGGFLLTSDWFVGLGEGSGRAPEYSTSRRLFQSFGVMSTPNSRAEGRSFKGNGGCARVQQWTRRGREEGEEEEEDHARSKIFRGPEHLNGLLTTCAAVE